MQGRSKCILIITFFILCGRGTFSQDKDYIFDHYNISNGLISDNVYKIFMDQTGYTWIITYNGLQKYDGYSFRTYTSKPDIPGTLSSNFVVDIFEDRDGDIIIILDDGIDIYHKHTDRFTNLLSHLPFGDAKRNEIIRQASVVQDRSGSIWTTCHNQLVRVDSSKENFFVYEDDFRGNFVLDPNSTALWIITEHTIKKYDLKTKILSITNIDDIPSPVNVTKLNTIFYDSKGICWLGTSEGLLIFDEKKFRFIEPDLYFPQNSGFTKGRFDRNITAIYEDYNNDLWIASGTLLCRIDRLTSNIQMLMHETENNNSILDEQITGIYGNGSGNIWVTYLNEGYTCINIRTKNFHSYRLKEENIHSLGGRTVRSVYKDLNGYVWVGLYNDGLDRIDPDSEMILHSKYNPLSESSICSNYISSIFVDNNQRLWVGSHDNGLCYAEDVYGRKLFFKRTSFLNKNDEIYHIQGDDLGRIWFGTRSGLGMYDPSNGKFQWILEGHNVQSFLFDNNAIWIASWNFGLCKLNFCPEQFASASPVFDTTTSINFRVDDYSIVGAEKIYQNGIQNCISIYQDQESDIWIGTYDKGLARVIIEDKQCHYIFYDITKGAPGNAVYGVAGDNQGNIWISTNRGIGKFDPDSEHFENFYRVDGLLSNYFMWKAYFQAIDGELFFGNMDGLNFFYPDEIFEDTLRPKALVSEFRIHNQRISIGDTINGDVVLSKHITYQDTLILNYKNSNLSFEFFASGNLNPDNLVFAHILEGFEDDWIIHEKGNRIASYNNLEPGTYHFKVKSTKREGYLDDEYTEKTIIILPPWWKTKLAYVLYISVLIGLIFLISNSLIRFLGLKHELIYNEKLHQTKLMFFTNVSHEFKTPLSLIIAPLNEALTDKGLSPHSRRNLRLARQNADNLLSLVNELLEFRRTDAGISKLKPELIDLTTFVTDISQQFESLADQKGLQFYLNFPDSKLNIWVDKEKFRKIIYNLIENAMKHTPNGGLITLSIIRNPEKYKFREKYHTLHLNQNQKDAEYIGILISDSGVGISRESLPKIFDRFYQIEAEKASNHIGSGIGLALVKNLVLMHQGEIMVASQRGEGTDIMVLLPLGDIHLIEEEVQPMNSSYSNKRVNSGKDKILRRPDRQINLEVNNNLPKILLVEDHEQLRTFLKDNFSDEFIIFEASNGEEGIERLYKIQPDLIITDWIMPVMDGKAFLKQIKSIKSASSIPVIFLTAKDDLEDQQEGLDLGADLIITKPFNLQLLKSQVQRMIKNNHSRIQKYGIETTEHLVEVKDHNHSKLLEEVERIIYKHIEDTSLDAAFIARELAFSRTALYSKIKEISGLTIGEYIQKIRLKHAVKLMLYENLSVSEVSVMVGISSSSYLIRLFKKYYQTTPKEYIKTIARIPEL